MSYYSIKFQKDLISSFLVVRLLCEQTDNGEKITILAEVITCNAEFIEL